MLNKSTYNRDELYKHRITIYTEANPNPNSMKFVLSVMLLQEGQRDYPNRELASESPLAQALFDEFDFVERVFISKNFLTVTKNTDREWIELSPQMREFLKAYFESEMPVFNETMPQSEVLLNNDTETVKKIKSILEDYVKPAVEQDGGAIVYENFDAATGVLKLQLQGSCSGCPSSTVTLKSGIQALFQRMMPEVKEVIA
jgi:Fe-S cluster biogenesis protein NfuA